jgi:hypothetical protein
MCFSFYSNHFEEHLSFHTWLNYSVSAMATRTKIRRNPNAGITTGFYSERNQAARARRRALPPGFGGPPKADGNASAEDGGELDQDDVKMGKQPERPNLPFSKSYVGLLPPPTGPHKRPPRKTWPTPAVPITWPNDPNIPEDWTCEELDLDPEYVSPAR